MKYDFFIWLALLVPLASGMLSMAMPSARMTLVAMCVGVFATATTGIHLVGGVLREGNVIVAGPGERVRVDSATAERYVREGKAHFPRN